METDPIHLDEVAALALLHGELAPPRAARAQRHLAECAECRAAVERAAREEEAIDRALVQLDHPAPPLTPRALADLAGRRAPSVATRWAAAILLGVIVAGAAYAIPGSPVPAWVASLAERLGGAGRAGRAVAPAPVPARDTAAAPGTSGIEVTPGRRLVIEFSGLQEAGAVTIRLTREATVAVRAPAGAAAFTTGRNRLLIQNAGRFDYELDIARRAPSVEVWIGSRLAFAVAAGVVRAGPPAAADGTYRIAFAIGR